MDPTTLIVQATIAYYVTVVIQWLKNASWFTWLQPRMKTAQRAVSIVVALLASIGVSVHASWDPQIGQFILTIGGLTLATLGHGLVQFALQEISYTKLVQPPKNGGLL